MRWPKENTALSGELLITGGIEALPSNSKTTQRRHGLVEETEDLQSLYDLVITRGWIKKKSLKSLHEK